jgi:hypothetical protein
MVRSVILPDQPITYEFDIFISYRRHAPVLEWVKNHFEPRLTEWLGTSWPNEPRDFRDEIEVGSDWPLRLENGLARSGLLVAVWSPGLLLLTMVHGRVPHHAGARATARIADASGSIGSDLSCEVQ